MGSKQKLSLVLVVACFFCVPAYGQQPRVALVIRYAPWWLNLTPSIRGAPDHARMVIETGGKNYDAVPLGRNVFELLPENVKPLYQHFVEE